MARPLLKFKLLSPQAKLPEYAHAQDAGFDLFSAETVTLAPGQRHVFKIGIASEIPLGYFVSIRDKSGLAAGKGLHVLGGVIDAGYRGEWGVVLVNLGNTGCMVEKGDKIAQGILQPAPKAQIVETDQLSDTSRGTGGFGSTGRK